MLERRAPARPEKPPPTRRATAGVPARCASSRAQSGPAPGSAVARPPIARREPSNHDARASRRRTSKSTLSRCGFATRLETPASKQCWRQWLEDLFVTGRLLVSPAGSARRAAVMAAPVPFPTRHGAQGYEACCHVVSNVRAKARTNLEVQVARGHRRSIAVWDGAGVVRRKLLAAWGGEARPRVRSGAFARRRHGPAPPLRRAPALAGRKPLSLPIGVRSRAV
jgi:hypothetical protein